MGNSGRERALERFDLPVMVRAYTDLYDKFEGQEFAGRKAAVRAGGCMPI
jgi:hypothetical protein